MICLFSRSAWRLPPLLVIGCLAVSPLFAQHQDLPLNSGLLARLDFITPGGTPIECSSRLSQAESQLLECGDYRMELSLQEEGAADILRFRLSRQDLEPFRLSHYSLAVTVPYVRNAGVWSYNQTPTMGNIQFPIGREFQLDTAANLGIPMAVLADRFGFNLLTIGLLGQHHQVSVRGEPSQTSDSYTLSATVVNPAAGVGCEDGFYVSRAQRTWYEEAQQYTRSVDARRGYQPIPIPAHAFNPTYDSWYWSSDWIDQSLVWDMAQLAQETGFTSYLIDAGWDTRTGEYFKWLGGSTGDYMPPPDLFPDFTGLLDDIRNRLGLRTLLWTQQYALGRSSVHYPEMGGALSRVIGESGSPEETPALCPRVNATREHITRLFERLLNDFSVDGFWFDWQDNLPWSCQADHEHIYGEFGEAYNLVQQETLNTIRRVSPDALIEMRWPSANLNNKPYTNLWQPNDSPGDFETMRLQAMNMRAFSQGVAMGTDEMYWDPDLTDTEAARFMAAVVFSGVPYFGPDLKREPTNRLEMLRSWLSFYDRHKTDLAAGTFTPYGSFNRPDQKIEAGNATYIYYGNRYNGTVRLDAPGNTLYIVNASGIPGIDLRLSGLNPGTYHAEVSDLYLQKSNEVVVTYASTARIRFNVPVGCLLTLTRSGAY